MEAVRSPLLIVITSAARDLLFLRHPERRRRGVCAAACHMANQAYFRKSVVTWDEATSTIKG